MKVLILLAVAFIANATTIIGPTDIGNTSAFVDIPSNIMDITPVGGSWSAFDIDEYDQTFTYTVTGGTGDGVMTFFTDLQAIKCDEPSGTENLTSFSIVDSPFFLMAPPAIPQGSTPVICGILGEFPCSLSFTFGVPLELRWHVTSAAGYTFNRFLNGATSTLAGTRVSASSTVALFGVGRYDPDSGWTQFNDATVTIEPVTAATPEPGTFAMIAGAGFGLLALGRIKARVPVRDRA